MRARWITLVALIAAGPRAAQAGNDEDVLVGNEASMSGGAVTATTSDGAAAFYNPAGLASVERDSVDISGSVFALHHYAIDRFIESSTGQSTDARATELLSIPSALTLVRSMSPKSRLGLGLFVPKSADVRLQEVLEAQGAVDSTWVLDLGSSGQVYRAVASLGYEFSKNVRIGFGLAGVYRSTTSRISFFGDVDAPGGESTLFGTTVDARNWTLGLDLTAGLQVDVSEAVTLGLSVRSPSADLYASFAADTLQSSAATNGMSGPFAELVPGSQRQGGLGLASLAPPVVRGGVAMKWKSGWLALGSDFRPPWQAEDFQVQRQAVWNLRVGGIMQLRDWLRVGAGLFTDRASEPSPESFAEAKTHFYGASVGMQIDNRHQMAEHERAESIVFSTTIAARYAYGSGTVGGLLIDLAAEEGIRAQRLAITVHELGLYIGSGLYF